MRDGVILRADVYRPRGEGRRPALLQRTPYSKNPGQPTSQYHRFAQAGFVVVVQDTRGRYMSDGVAVPHDEGADGYDTIEWVAQLPYVDGRVGMFGGSYSATVQLLAAPHATAASRGALPIRLLRQPLRHGVPGRRVLPGRRPRLEPRPGEGRAPARAGARGGSRSRDRPHARRAQAARCDVVLAAAARVDGGAPGAALLARLLRSAGASLVRPFWTTFDVAAKHPQFEVPAYHLTGWYDSLLNGTLQNFSGLRANAGTDRARKNQRLIVGPWTHARPTKATTKIADVDFGPTRAWIPRASSCAGSNHWMGARDHAAADWDGPPVPPLRDGREHVAR